MAELPETGPDGVITLDACANIAKGVRFAQQSSYTAIAEAQHQVDQAHEAEAIAKVLAEVQEMAKQIAASMLTSSYGGLHRLGITTFHKALQERLKGMVKEWRYREPDETT